MTLVCMPMYVYQHIYAQPVASYVVAYICTAIYGPLRKLVQWPHMWWLIYAHLYRDHLESQSSGLICGSLCVHSYIETTLKASPVASYVIAYVSTAI